MKRILVFGLLICLSIGLFSGFTKKENSKEFAERFINVYFTIVDYTKINFSDENFMTLYQNDYSKKIHSLMSDKAFKAENNNRSYICFLEAAVNGKCNTKIGNVKITKSEAAKDGSLVYNYTATLHQLFSDKKTVSSNLNGQVSVKKIGKDWKITVNWYDPRFMLDLLKKKS